MDIDVKRMSSAAIEMLDQLSIVCKRFGVDYYDRKRGTAQSKSAFRVKKKIIK